MLCAFFSNDPLWYCTSHLSLNFTLFFPITDYVHSYTVLVLLRKERAPASCKYDVALRNDSKLHPCFKAESVLCENTCPGSIVSCQSRGTWHLFIQSTCFCLFEHGLSYHGKMWGRKTTFTLQTAYKHLRCLLRDCLDGQMEKINILEKLAMLFLSIFKKIFSVINRAQAASHYQC